jgi:hypothetical protein
MPSNAKAGQGTTLSWAGNVVSDITKIGGLEIKAKEIDVTNLASVAREFISGVPDGGEIKIEGNLYPGDTNGQVALKNAVGGAAGAVVITLPTAIGANWSFNALVTSFSAGEADTEGAVPFSATLKVTGAPTLNISTSAGLTTPFATLSGSGTLIPAAAQATLNYVYSVLTAVATITITPTASAGVITITANGVSQVVISGSVTPVTVSVQETGKQPKIYTIQVARA